MSNVRPHLCNHAESPSSRYAPPVAAVATEKLPPRLRSPIQWSLAAIGAASLAAANLSLALEYAGPYKSLVVVWLSVLSGLFVCYLSVLRVTVFLASRPSRHLPGVARFAGTALLAFVCSIILFMVPILAFYSLVTICKVQPLCPMAANPISWSFLGVATRLGWATVYAFGATGLLLVTAAVLRNRKPFLENEA